jgi:PPOX class probable F420-dependent enzyme
MDVPPWVHEVLEHTRVARLATVDAAGDARLVPVCFAVVGDALVSAVDHKPKRTGQLRRLDDAQARGRATLLLDHYEEDWTALWWVRVRGAATVHAPGSPAAVAAVEVLCAKYEQYRQQPPVGSVLAVAADELRWWRWSDADT